MEFADELCQHDEPQIMPEIEAMRNDFYRAHSGTSFSPDKRAESCVNDFSAELAADLERLGDHAGNYKAKYIDYLRQWAGRKSRCMSAMITGPAKFPTASNGKKLDAEERIWNEFRVWRDKFFKHAFAEPTPAPEDELISAERNLETKRKAHQMMIDINKIFRRNKTPEETRRMFAEELTLKPEFIDSLMKPKQFGRKNGFDTFELANSNVTIKRLEEKVLTMKSRIQTKGEFEPISFTGGSIAIENDRVVIYHDSKPDADIIAALKHKGFRWSPRFKCWCRKHTAQALFDAKKICGVQ